MEIWKDIKGYEGLYQVSSYGRVRSLDRYVKGCYNSEQLRKGKILKQLKHNNDYLFVGLNKEGKQKICSVHRLVAEAFIPNPEHLPCVNHKDENKTNNHIDNLEWCSHEYNSNYGTLQERKSEKRKIPILQCDLDGNLIREWDSALKVEQEINIKRKNICSVCAGKRKTAGGYTWKYKNKKEDKTI